MYVCMYIKQGEYRMDRERNLRALASSLKELADHGFRLIFW